MIGNAVKWLKEHNSKPWLVLGKGPSFAKRREFDLNEYALFSLNHVIAVQGADIAHFIDLEALIECSAALMKSRAVVFVPWQPHAKMRPGSQTLDQMRPDIFKELEMHDRLFSYNSTTGSKNLRNLALPVVRVRFFSACAAASLLMAAGVKSIYTLGVDGGANYAEEFDKKNCLANGRKSFDVQFKEISYLCKKYGATCMPL